MKINYVGHSCFILQDSHGAQIIIDPFISDNPMTQIRPEDIKVDAVLLTHGHDDHVGDALSIAKANNAPVIAPFELVNYCVERGVKGHPMHIGGAHEFPFGQVKLTIAFHGSTTDTGAVGNPCGLLITMDDKKIYHAGDTALFSDMALYGPVDCALLPIGDNFTMGIEDAAKAARLIQAKVAIPMHYNTWEIIAQDPEEFKKALADSGTEVKILNPGESAEI